MCGIVSRATVAENARRGVARDSAGGTKRWNAKARKGRNRRGYPLAPRAHPFQPGTGAGGAESARTPGMVGRERRGGRNAASGAGRREPLVNRDRRLVTQPTSWRTQKGRGRLGRPPTPQAPQGRGAQWWSRDAERPRAFRNCISIVVLRVQFCKELAGCCPDTNAIYVAHLEVVRGSPKGVVVHEDAMDNG